MWLKVDDPKVVDFSGLESSTVRLIFTSDNGSNLFDAETTVAEARELGYIKDANQLVSWEVVLIGVAVLLFLIFLFKVVLLSAKK